MKISINSILNKLILKIKFISLFIAIVLPISSKAQNNPFDDNATDYYSPTKIEKAEIKGIRMRMKESEVLKIITGTKLELDENNPSKKTFYCSSRLEKKYHCNFTIAGEKVNTIVLIFHDGILRTSIFTIALPNLRQSNPNSPLSQEAYALDFYMKVGKAFVEKFEMPMGNMTRIIENEIVSEVFEKAKTLHKSYNRWTFGDEGEIFLNYKLENYSQLYLEFFDRKWDIKLREDQEKQKQIKIENEEKRDLNFRKKDL